ncbi:MAG: transposase, partial [Gemmatimonadaceae bacterium]
MASHPGNIRRSRPTGHADGGQVAAAELAVTLHLPSPNANLPASEHSTAPAPPHSPAVEPAHHARPLAGATPHPASSSVWHRTASAAPLDCRPRSRTPVRARLARYCARNPVALERLTYDRTAKAVTYRSDKAEGPTAGTETADPLECLARVLVHIPDKGQVTTRDYGWYANRPRGMRGKAAPAAADGPPAIVPAPRLAPTEASRRWAALFRQIFEVDPLACPTCQGAMRIVACITQASVIDRILTHLRTRAAPAAHTAHAGARSPPS